MYFGTRCVTPWSTDIYFIPSPKIDTPYGGWGIYDDISTVRVWAHISEWVCGVIINQQTHSRYSYISKSGELSNCYHLC